MWATKGGLDNMGEHDAINSVSSLSKVIYEYGPAVTLMAVILILFVVILFYFLRSQQKANENIMNEHKMLIETMINQQKEREQQFLALQARQNKPEVSNKELMDTYIKINNDIKSHVAVNIVMLSACRLSIFLFHNGTKSLSKFPFFKFSCICEQTTNVRYVRINRQHDYPVNLMSDFVSNLYENREISYYNTDSRDAIDNDPMLKKILSNHQDKFIIRGIFDSASSLVGFVLVEFPNDSINDENYPEKSKIMDELVDELTPIFEYSNLNQVYQEANK